MPYARSNYKTTRGEIPADTIQASQLATNVFFTCMPSQLVNFRVTIQHDSLSGDVCTFSMEGYGRAAWVYAIREPHVTVANGTFLNLLRTSVATDSSFGYLTIDGETYSYGSMAATVSIPYLMMALIASR